MRSTRLQTGPDIVIVRHPTRPFVTLIGSTAYEIANTVSDVVSRSHMLSGFVIHERHLPDVHAICQLRHLLLVEKRTGDEGEAA